VTTESPPVRQFVLLADDSAHWRIAGLTQLERILLAVSEFAGLAESEGEVSAVLFWKPEMLPSQRRAFTDARLTRITFTESLADARRDAIVLSTRFFIGRNGIAEVLPSAQFPRVEEPIANSLECWNKLARNLEAFRKDKAQGSVYLTAIADLPECEKRFLRGAGKSQDGLVSRFLNRPVSRVLTRFLLRFPISPTGWTIAIFVLPLAAFFFLLRGDYIGLLTGAFIFQVYSILDGCDGEIARAKYLESARGGRIDDFLDMLGSLFFVVGLGIGLSRAHGVLYQWEGIACAAVILLNEMVLRLSRPQSPLPSAERIPPWRDGVPTGSSSLAPVLYPRHRDMIQNSGLLMLGERNAWWIVQFTKRDVAVFCFLLLALANLGPWILHLWITVSTVTLALTIRARVRRGGS